MLQSNPVEISVCEQMLDEILASKGQAKLLAPLAEQVLSDARRQFRRQTANPPTTKEAERYIEARSKARALARTDKWRAPTSVNRPHRGGRCICETDFLWAWFVETQMVGSSVGEWKCEKPLLDTRESCPQERAWHGRSSATRYDRRTKWLARHLKRP